MAVGGISPYNRIGISKERVDISCSVVEVEGSGRLAIPRGRRLTGLETVCIDIRIIRWV